MSENQKAPVIVADLKKKEKRNQFLERLVTDNLSQKTGLLMQMSIFGDLNPLKSLNDLSLNNQGESQKNFEEIRNKINLNSGYNNQQNKSLIQQLPQILKELTSHQVYNEVSPVMGQKWNINQSQYLQKHSLESTKYIQQGYKPQESIRYLSIELDYNGKNNNGQKNQIFKTSDTKFNSNDQSIQNQEIEQQNMSQLMENKQKQVVLTNQQNRVYNQIQKNDQYSASYLPTVQKNSNILNLQLKSKQNQYHFENIQSTQKNLQDSDYFVNKIVGNIGTQFRKKQDFSSDSNSLNSNRLSQTVFMNQTAINRLVEKNNQNQQSQNNQPSIIRNSGIQEVIVQSYEKKKQDYDNLEKKQSKQNIDVKRIKDSQLGMAQLKVSNQKHRNQQGKLNYSMHFERGEIKKFERYLDKAFSNKQKVRNKANAMSVDHSMLNNEILIDDFQTNHQVRNSEYERNQDSSLPQITNRQLYQSIQQTGRRQVMQSMDCSTFISYKDKLNQLGKVEDKFKLIEQAAIKKNVQNNYFLQSHHYKYNRLKDGGWGKEQQISAQVSASDIIKNEIIASKFKQNRNESNQIIGSARIFTDDMSNILFSSKQNQIQSFQDIESNRLIKMENQKPIINISKIMSNQQSENKNIMYGENAEKFIKQKQMSKIQNRKNELNQYKTSSQQHLAENETIKLPRPLFSPRMDMNDPLGKKSFDKICVSRNTIKTEKTIHVNKTGITPADASQDKIMKGQIDKSKIVFLKQKSIDKSILDEIETKVQNKTSDGNVINDTMNFEESSKYEDYNNYQLKKMKDKNQNNIEITNESLKETSENYLTKFTNTNPRMLNINQTTFIYNQSPALSQNNERKTQIIKIPEFRMKKQIINIKKMENNEQKENDKDLQQINFLSQHLQQQYEKQEKEEFNRIYEYNDRQMRYLQGSQIKHDYNQNQNDFNGIQDQSQFMKNDKNTQKKYRKQILEQIELVKLQIKQKKIENKKVKQLNDIEQKQFGQQIEMNNRLGSLIQTLEYNQAQNEKDKDQNQEGLQIIFQNNKADQNKTNILTIQQQNEVDSVFDANQSHDSQTKKKNKSTWDIEKQQYSLLNQNSIRSQKLDQSRQNIHEFYKYLYQPDLNQAKERTEQEIFIVNNQNQIMHQELQLLKIENESLRNFIKRYNRLIKEQQDKKEAKDQDQQNDKKKEIEINMELINQQLYKGHNDGKELNLGQKTQQSFGISRAPQIIDVKKIEQINLSFQKIFKQPKVIDTIVMFIQCLKNQFKTDQVCVYIIDVDLQANLFHNYQSSRNIKKIDINAGEHSTKSLHQVFAIFDKDRDFSLPLFKDLDDAGNNIFNNKAILIPVKKQKQILFSFQILYNFNKNSKKNKKEKQKRRQKKNAQSVMERTSQRSSSALSNSECQSPRRGNSFTGLSQFSNYKAAQKQKNIQGWNMNDYNLIKVYVNYISMNIDYYFGLTQIKSKSKTVHDIIDFSLDIMDVKTFRQLVRKVQQYKETIFGFKEVSLFFLNEKTNELFTLTNIEVADRVKRETEFDTFFARELIFPDESVVIIPSTIGMSGEVHRKIGMQYGNNFGQIGKKEEEQIELNDSDDQLSPMSVYSRKIHQGFGHNENKRTKLEKIIEDHPFEENDNDTIELAHAQQEFKVGKIQNDIKIESPLPQNYLKEYDFNSEIDQIPNQSPNGNIFQELIDSDSPIIQRSSTNHKRSQIYNESQSPKKSFQAVIKGKQQLRLSKIEISQKQTVQSLNFGEKSVGILQLFNKLEDKNINQSDIARIEQISRLIGALAIKTQTYTQCLTLIIGMEGLEQKTSVANNLSKKITEYIQPGLGLFEKLEVPIDLLMQFKFDS